MNLQIPKIIYILDTKKKRKKRKMKHNYCQSPSQLSPRQQSHFPRALTDQEGEDYVAVMQYLLQTQQQHSSQMQQPSQNLEEDDNNKMSAEEKEEYKKQQQNDGNDNNALPSIVVPPRILEESEPLYNHKGDCLVPKMLIVDVNKDDKQFRCNVRSCKVTQPMLMLPCYCFNERNHPKYAHECCFKEHILKRHSVQHPDPKQRENARVGMCTKSCYLKYKAAFEKEPQSDKVVPWENDGAKGTNDPLNSAAIVIERLSDPVWYSKFCGDNRQGRTKTSYANDLSMTIKSKGCKKERTAKDVLNFIERKLKQWKLAYEWTQETGQGVKESGDEKGFEDYVRKLCPFYYDLYDVLSVRAGIEPIANSDLLHNSDDSNNDDDDDDDGVGDVDDDDDDQCVAQRRTHGGILPSPSSDDNDNDDDDDDDDENAIDTNAVRQLFPTASSSSTGSIHPVTGTDSSLTQSTISTTAKKRKEKKTHGVQIGRSNKRNGSNLSSTKSTKVNKTKWGEETKYSYTDMLNGQIKSSTEHRQNELSIREQEYQLHLQQEQRSKVNDDLETQSRKLKLLEQRTNLYFKLQEKGWDDARIVQFHPDLISCTSSED